MVPQEYRSEGRTARWLHWPLAARRRLPAAPRLLAAAELLAFPLPMLCWRRAVPGMLLLLLATLALLLLLPLAAEALLPTAAAQRSATPSAADSPPSSRCHCCTTVQPPARLPPTCRVPPPRAPGSPLLPPPPPPLLRHAGGPVPRPHRSHRWRCRAGGGRGCIAALLARLQCTHGEGGRPQSTVITQSFDNGCRERAATQGASGCNGGDRSHTQASF